MVCRGVTTKENTDCAPIGIKVELFATLNDDNFASASRI
jgi:hypothetical protein